MSINFYHITLLPSNSDYNTTVTMLPLIYYHHYTTITTLPSKGCLHISTVNKKHYNAALGKCYHRLYTISMTIITLLQKMYSYYPNALLLPSYFPFTMPSSQRYHKNTALHTFNVTAPCMMLLTQCQHCNTTAAIQTFQYNCDNANISILLPQYQHYNTTSTMPTF